MEREQESDVFEGAGWQLLTEGSVVVVMPEGLSQDEFEAELVEIVAEAGVDRCVFEWDGRLVSIRVFSVWENVLFRLGMVWSDVCRVGRRLAGR